MAMSETGTLLDISKLTVSHVSSVNYLTNSVIGHLNCVKVNCHSSFYKNATFTVDNETYC